MPDIETFDFTSEFQNLVLACWIRHPEKFLCYGPILNPRSFSGVQSTLTASALYKFYTKHGRFPSWRMLKQLVLDEAAQLDSSRDEAASYLDQLLEIDTVDVDVVATRVRDFMRERALLSAVRKVVENIQDGKAKAKVDVIQLFEDALQIGQNLDELGLVFHDDIDRVVDKVTARGYGLKTGIQMVDEVWPNGWMPGWLIVPLAPPKRYKTMFCLNVAMNVVSPAIGKNVFYYSCEISQELAMTRGLSKLTGLTQNDMFKDPARFKSAAHDAAPDMIAGYLVFKDFAAGTATIQDLRAHTTLVMRQLGIEPHLIIIDYAETVLPSERKNQDHREQANIYTEARALGKYFNCPVLMPDRCNGETVDKPVPNMRSFQGAFQKAGIVDGAIGLCATEAEYQLNTIRGFIFINRHGKAFQHFRGQVDPEKMHIQFDEEIPYEPEERGGDKAADAATGNGKGRKRSSRPGAALPEELQDP